MRTTGVLKIVKSVSRVLKTEAVFIYVAKGDGKKRGKEKEKMCTINFTFRRPGAATCAGIPLTLMPIMSFAVGRVLRLRIHVRPLQSIVTCITYIMYGIISFFSVTRRRWLFEVYSCMQTRFQLSVGPEYLISCGARVINTNTHTHTLCPIFRTLPRAHRFQHPPFIIPTLNTRPPKRSP